MSVVTSMGLFLRLKEALGLPENCFEVNIRLSVDAAVEVEAKYFAQEKALDLKTGLVPIFTSNYVLVEVEPNRQINDVTCQGEFSDDLSESMSPEEIVRAFDRLIREQDA